MGSTTRIALIDIARTIALVAMVIFHFTYDLELFGFVERGTMLRFEWIWFAKCIAGSFIFLSGVSLALTAAQGPLNLSKYGWRLLKIGAAALAVTLGTYVAMGDAFVRFGILHLMLAASILGLIFLRVPFWCSALAGIVILALPSVMPWPLLDSTNWLWLGQTISPLPPMVDYEPLVPWFGVFLIGMACGQWVTKIDGWPAIAGLMKADSVIVRLLSWPGQHSLAVYLLHQPVLFGGVSLARYLAS